jgi:hypothetical protein
MLWCLYYSEYQSIYISRAAVKDSSGRNDCSIETFASAGFDDMSASSGQMCREPFLSQSTRKAQIRPI